MRSFGLRRGGHQILKHHVGGLPSPHGPADEASGESSIMTAQLGEDLMDADVGDKGHPDLVRASTSNRRSSALSSAGDGRHHSAGAAPVTDLGPLCRRAASAAAQRVMAAALEHVRQVVVKVAIR